MSRFNDELSFVLQHYQGSDLNLQMLRSSKHELTYHLVVASV